MASAKLCWASGSQLSQLPGTARACLRGPKGHALLLEHCAKRLVSIVPRQSNLGWADGHPRPQTAHIHTNMLSFSTAAPRLSSNTCMRGLPYLVAEYYRTRHVQAAHAHVHVHVHVHGRVHAARDTARRALGRFEPVGSLVSLWGVNRYSDLKSYTTLRKKTGARRRKTRSNRIMQVLVHVQ